MIAAIDHVVVLVDNLERAGAEYAARGFTVTPGGEHTDGATHNLLVTFADGSYLELLAFRREAPGHRWWRYREAGPGLIDFALLPTTIDRDVAAAAERGLRLHGPLDGGRLRPDGVQLAWRTAMAETDDLPFLCGDVTPRELRVPGGANCAHANGVTGIAEVMVAVNDLAASGARYAALLGLQPEEHAGMLRFPLSAGAICLRSPGPHEPFSADLALRLARRGEGVAMLRFSHGTVSGITWDGRLI